MRLIPGRVSANVIPGRAGTDEDVHLYLNAGIAIHAAERDSVNPTVMGAA